MNAVITPAATVAVAVAPVPPPPLMVTVGADVYPVPPVVTLIEASVVGFSDAVAAAPDPPPPEKPTVGGAVYPVPAAVIATLVTAPLVVFTSPTEFNASTTRSVGGFVSVASPTDDSAKLTNMNICCAVRCFAKPNTSRRFQESEKLFHASR